LPQYLQVLDDKDEGQEDDNGGEDHF